MMSLPLPPSLPLSLSLSLPPSPIPPSLSKEMLPCVFVFRSPARCHI